jgi:glycosyltransferase involved in cell wall biosynthesis
MMNNSESTPRVSVIIPVYNCPDYVGQAVKSVLNQTYQDYEIIVIDDGSTAETYQALQPYMDSIRYIYQHNQGVASARNKGIEMAQGKLIAFLDHDDYFLPNKLALQVACFDAQPEVGIVHSGCRRVNAKGEVIKDVEPWHQVPTLNLEGWLQWKPILPSAMMFDREWLNSIGGFNTQFHQAPDVYLVLDLSLKGCQAAWVNQVTVCYREHEKNESLKTPIQVAELWEVIDNFLKQEDIPLHIRKKENNYRYHTLVWAAWRLYQTGYVSLMIDLLNKSLEYTPYLNTETLSDWIKNFILYSTEMGNKLDSEIFKVFLKTEILKQRR